MLLKRLQATFAPTLYVQVWEYRLRVTNQKTGQVYDDAPLVAIETRPDGEKLVAALGAAAGQLPLRSNIELVNPFSHPRTPLKDFAVAEKLMMFAFREVCGKGILVAAPAVVIHPMEKLEGGLTQIERKAFRELALGAGARAVTVHEGEEELSPRFLNFDALAKHDPDILTAGKKRQSPAFVTFMVVISALILLLSFLANAKGPQDDPVLVVATAPAPGFHSHRYRIRDAPGSDLRIWQHRATGLRA